MNVADPFIKRPVFSLMLNLSLVVLGLFSYRALGLDLFPKIDFPIVRIYAAVPGAGPEEIETQIAKPIEEAVNTIGGIDTLTSKCMFGAAQVVVRFTLEKDIDVAAQEVRDRIARIVKDFPQGTEPPIIEKMDPDAQPIITLIISSPMKLRELTTFVKKRVKEPLEALGGVGAIQMVGGRTREIRAELDAKKLAAYGISAGQVKDALASQNIEIPGGNVTSGPEELVLRTLGRIEDPALFADVVVATINGVPVRVRDLGAVVDDEAEPRSFARLDGENAFSLVIQKQSGANTVDVIDRINRRLAELRPTLPADLTFTALRDQSAFIKASLHELNFHLVGGALLASLVVYLFMGSLISTFISSLAIPVSIIATFFAMRLAGFTLNNMSMLGLTLAVGIVIDDAIVVLENIFRHIEELGKDAVTAAREGTAEIYAPVMATSLSLMVIFVPVAFMEGIIGRFLNNFGLTVAFAVGISIFVSFTLTPMLCSLIFQYRFARGGSGRHGTPARPCEPGRDEGCQHKGAGDEGFDDHAHGTWLNALMVRGYGALLRRSLDHRWLVVAASLACLLLIPLVGRRVSKDFVPPDDTNEYSIYFRAGEGSSLEGTKRLLDEIEPQVARLPGVKHVFSTIGEGSGTGVNEAYVNVQLVPLAERSFSVFDSIELARAIMKRYPDYRPSVQPSGGMQGMGRQGDVMLYLVGPDLAFMQRSAQAIIERIRARPDLCASADSSFIEAKPEVHVTVDRERAYRMGVRMDSVAAGLRTLVGGNDQISRFKEADELYEVRTRLRPDDRASVEDIAELMVPSTNGGMVRLDSFSTVVRGTGPAFIDRQDRQRAVTVIAFLAKGVGVGELNDLVAGAAAELQLPPEYQTGFTGRSREMSRTVKGFVIAFLMSAIFMYLVLASQFESLLHPVTIMLSLPLSLPFALLSLWIAGFSLNIFSALGVFMLFGIIKKNAILQIDFTNTLRERGLPRHQAVMQANLARLRPILMTTVTLVASMLPMAFGTGAGASTRASMAVVIIGGQTLSLLITLLLTPTAYTLFDDLVVWLGHVLPAPAKD